MDSRAPLLPAGTFAAAIREPFARRAAVVFGNARADDAARRFAAAVKPLLAAATDVVIVTHGTVLALFVADVAGVDPYGLWRSLDLPCAVTLSRPALQVEGITTIGVGR